MKGIYYKDGVYVVIDDDIENDFCLLRFHYKENFTLYGGRIKLKVVPFESGYMNVDGISVINITEKEINKKLPFSVIASHLNAIEANGVDAFLENYKKSIEFLYGELKEMNQKTESLLTSEQDDSKIKILLSEIEKMRELLFSILAILFSLYSYMTAGLENEKVISVCQSIMDSLS